MICHSVALLGGKIYTIDPENTIAEAIVIKNGKIAFVGTSDQAKELIEGEDIEIIDLKGNVVFPGFVDTHVHVPGNAYNVMFNINLFDAKSVEETMDTIADFIKAHPERDIYYGRGYTSSLFPGLESGIGPRKERLDAICPDKPVIITDFGAHAFWLNSEAIRRFGITSDAKVEGGVVEVDPETGEVWGTLKDEAKCLFPDPEYTLDEKVMALDWLQKYLNAYGYTGVFALRPSGEDDPRPILAAMDVLEQDDKLTLRMVCSREIKVMEDEFSQIDETAELAKKYADGMVKVKTAKFFIDGTVEGTTGLLLEPYEAAAGKGENYFGTKIWEEDRLIGAFKYALSKGLNLHLHAIGDGAVREAVEAIEAAQKEYPGDHRNTITHLQLVSEQDKVKMHELGIVACCNVHWHFKDPSIYFNAEVPFLGKERAEKEYPLKSLLDHGIVITCAGDIPITAYPNPFFAIQFGVTRNLVNASFYKVDPITDMDDPKWLLNKDERVSVMDMVKAYTINAAFANHIEDETGSLEVGKYGDLIVIDRDILNIDPMEIEKTKLLCTIVGGAIVYKA